MEAMFTGSVVDLPAYGINPRDVRVFLHSGDFRIDVGSPRAGLACRGGGGYGGGSELGRGTLRPVAC